MTFTFCIGDTNGQIDPEDAQRLFGRLVRVVSGGYLVVKVGRRERLLHRYLLGLEHGNPIEVDHVNGDRADNRRANLRIATPSQNGANRRDVAGVYWCKQRERWCAQIAVNRKRINLGRFTTRDDALAARRAAEDLYQGEFAARHGVNRGH